LIINSKSSKKFPRKKKFFPSYSHEVPKLDHKKHQTRPKKTSNPTKNHLHFVLSSLFKSTQVHSTPFQSKKNIKSNRNQPQPTATNPQINPIHQRKNKSTPFQSKKNITSAKSPFFCQSYIFPEPNKSDPLISTQNPLKYP